MSNALSKFPLALSVNNSTSLPNMSCKEILACEIVGILMEIFSVLLAGFGNIFKEDSIAALVSILAT